MRACVHACVQTFVHMCTRYNYTQSARYIYTTQSTHETARVLDDVIRVSCCDGLRIAPVDADIWTG